MLLALPIVVKLAEDTLTPSELNEAEQISVMLTGSKKQREAAIYHLMKQCLLLRNDRFTMQRRKCDIFLAGQELP